MQWSISIPNIDCVSFVTVIVKDTTLGVHKQVFK